MVEALQNDYEFEQQEETVTRSPAGLSDWGRAVKAIGNQGLANFIELMDPGNPGNHANTHTVIAERLRMLKMPSQPHVAVTVEDFIADPKRPFAQLGSGDYYFISIRPGTHLAHEESEAEVTSFVQNFAKESADPDDLRQELYLSRNGEPVLSGHIVVRAEDEPNSVYAEFTNGDFNSFHRGFRTPEIHVHRDRYRFMWEFGGSLTAAEGDWRTDDLFNCNGDVRLTRPEMARKIFAAISQIPHDGDAYLPGYYEVLLEKTEDGHARTAFIEAVTARAISTCL
jgi:hypothetical protein